MVTTIKNQINTKENRETWKVIPETKGLIQLSNKGSVRKVKPGGNQLVVNFVEPDIYEFVITTSLNLAYSPHAEIQIPVLKFRYESRTIIKPLAVLVYELFHGLANVEIRNILYRDGNVQNFSVDNLILCRREDFLNYFLLRDQSTIHLKSYPYSLSAEKFIDSISSMVTMYNGNGHFMYLFKNVYEVSKFSGLNSSQLNKELNGIKFGILDQCLIKYGRGPAIVDLTRIYTGEYLVFRTKSVFNSYLIRQYDLNGKLRRIFNNIYELAKVEKLDINDLYQHIKLSKLFQYEGYIWFVETNKRKF